MSKQIPIRQITLADDGAIHKINTLRGPRFALPILYHLADGQVVPSQYLARRKKDVIAHRNRLPHTPQNLEAVLSDGGEFMGITKITKQ